MIQMQTLTCMFWLAMKICSEGQNRTLQVVYTDCAQDDETMAV